MIQQINLYQYSDSDNTHVLSNPYLLAILAAIIIMGIIQGANINKLNENQAEIIKLREQTKQAQAHIQQLQALYPNQQVDNLLYQELVQTQKHYQTLLQTLEILADVKSDRSRGFSRYLTALADQADNQIWLTAIHFSAETDSITLKGSTLNPEQIPSFLKHLQNTNVFNGRQFSRLTIQQSLGTPEQIDFVVASNPKPETEDPNAGKR